MSRRAFSSITALMEDLLARHERKPGSTALIAAIDIDGFASIDQRDAFDEALLEIEREGGVDLVRKGPKTDRRITGARLKHPDVLYHRLGRQPAGQTAAQSLAALRSRFGFSPGAVDLIDTVAAAWGRGVSHIGIGRGEVRRLSNVIDLAIALRERLTGDLQADQDFRTFSRLTVGDSKALEKNLRQIAAALLRIFGPDDRLTGLEPDEILATAGINRLPQPVLIHGDVTMNAAPFPDMPYVGVPADAVMGLALRTRPDYVMTIENFTSFVRYTREIAQAQNALILYAGGFPSRPALAAMRSLAREAQAPTYHWGDMDPGGVRIFHHIEQHLAEIGICLLPHRMDAELLFEVGRPAHDKVRARFSMDGSAVAALAEALMSSGLVHEQEELDPCSPV